MRILTETERHEAIMKTDRPSYGQSRAKEYLENCGVPYDSMHRPMNDRDRKRADAQRKYRNDK